MRFHCPWDSPGKNTGVGCHFLLQCMKVKSESEVAQSCLTLSDPMNCSPPGSSIHGIFQAVCKSLWYHTNVNSSIRKKWTVGRKTATGGSQGRLNSAWSSEKLPEIGPGLHSQLMPEIEGAQISRGRVPGFLQDARSQRRSEAKGRGHELSALHVGQRLSPVESRPVVNTLVFYQEKRWPHNPTTTNNLWEALTPGFIFLSCKSKSDYPHCFECQEKKNKIEFRGLEGLLIKHKDKWWLSEKSFWEDEETEFTIAWNG